MAQFVAPRCAERLPEPPDGALDFCGVGVAQCLLGQFGLSPVNQDLEVGDRLLVGIREVPDLL